MLAAMGPEQRAAIEPAVLVFEDVSFVVSDGRSVLTGVSLEVAPGQVTVVVGPSGSGKSTLLRLGNRLDAPTAGVVRFKGVDLAETDTRLLRRNVGMVFQKPIPFAGSVRANLAIADSKASDQRFTAVLERVGLDETYLERIADDLSGGEAQRMCIARTLLTDPRVILMDEPTSALDPENRLGIEALALELANKGIGVVWVTHDLDQAHRIADRIEVLLEGQNASAQESASYLAPRGPGVDS